MGVLLFPANVLDFLAGAVHDPRAERSYEGLSDSFFWSDELLWEGLARYGVAYPFRQLIGYRSSVIRGAPDARVRPVWQQVAEACPGWPGLRPERSSPALAPELTRASRRFTAGFLRAMRECEREMAEGRRADPAGPPADGR
ncbi:MAG: hypothetical protein ACYC61_21240 [Isosphaeraceae bacterium]